MSEQKSRPSWWQRIGSVLTRIRLVLSNLIFFVFLALLLAFLFSGVPVPEVPDSAALVLDPQGAIVEQRSPVDPIQQWLAPQAVLAETELTALLDALEHARDDDRIRMAVLDLDDLQFVSTAHAETIGAALDAFREAGKDVVAYGSYFDQQPYLMASHASAVYMHPLGQVMLPGYAINQMYFKGLLEDLKVRIHVFRAGRYKEFVEPYVRSDMSAEAREANRALIDTLWQHYGDTVRANRDLEPDRFRRYTQEYDRAVEETNGDFARLAVEYHLVDELLTPDQARARIADTVGRNGEGDFNGIVFRDYLTAVDGEPDGPANGPQVAVIIGQGPVMMGNQVSGVIAAERIIGLIREARDDDQVRALVMRLDTPGGSAFASELIRQELELTQLAGKPVVVSMGPVAASGGYWIAATADAIVAEPTTITGSIGVFGLFPSFEESLSGIGVTTDGVRNTDLSQLNPLTGISEQTARVLQTGTEHTYRRFTNLVARGRGMAPEAVEEIAQGRVWIGTRALELGLVDALGGRDAAIARAAELAGLEDYGVHRITPPLSPRELLLRQLTGSVSVDVTGWLTGSEGTLVSPLARQAGDAWKLLNSLDDPRHSYALCLACGVNGTLIR